MFRKYNSSSSGGAFSEKTIEAVWQKGSPDSRYPGYRKDTCGVWMKRDKYGKTEDFGWEIDHINPVSNGGSDRLDNLQPLFWENNRHKADNYPKWYCKVSG